MRLFVVDINGEGAAGGQYMTIDDLTRRLEHARSRGPIKREPEENIALDEALIAMINIAHVGMVIPFRLGWIFLAEDASQ
jgi:hypothetical protein